MLLLILTLVLGAFLCRLFVPCKLPILQPLSTILFHNMKRLLLSFAILLVCHTTWAQRNYAALVNPMIGTGGHGHTFPGAVAPFGMVQLSPDTRVDGSWDGCSGYHHSDSVIYGFTHTHLSGTGCSDYGDVLLMPIVIDMPPKFNVFDYTKAENYKSTFSHQNEVANAGYYKVKLDRYNITAELTTSTRVGVHRYQFPKTPNAAIVIDLTHRDETLDAQLEIVNDSIVRGYRYSKAWATNQKVFFYLTFSKAIKGFANSPDRVKQIVTGKEARAIFMFDATDGKPITVKVALSGVDTYGAYKNLEAEVPHTNFDFVRSENEKQWNQELSKVDIKGGTSDDQTIFYTALYHTFIHPSTYSDVDCRYRGRDDKIYKTTGYTYYTVFSLWDTFRALHPLFNIIQRERNLDFIRTFLEQYKQVGLLPIWELSSNETNCMIGNHAVSVITDALAKGNNQFDTALAIEAAHASLSRNYRGLNLFRHKGYLEVEDEHESVSNTLEYSFNDWCMLQLLASTNQHDWKYEKGANAWKNVFNDETLFMRPRSNGGWYSPFNPSEVNNHFTEANSWQYSFFVPHDINGMITLSGGASGFEKRLDNLFSASTQTTGREQADITGLIGQYAHGNEPSHHMAYLYNYVNKPDKTQQLVHQILSTLYHNAPDGLSGNEDCGQMSAWYVMSAMGLYDVCPGGNQYAITKPYFNEITISAAKGKIKLLNSTSQQLQWEQGKWKSQPIDVSKRLFLPASLFYTSLTDSSIQVALNAAQTKANPITPAQYKAPVIEGNGIKFRDSSTIAINTWAMPTTVRVITATDTTEQFYYQGNPVYITLKNSAWVDVKSVAEINANHKDTLYASAHFHRIPNNYEVTLNSTFNKQYTAGGPDALVDGLHGYKDWRKGGWQGYQSQDFDAVIDLKEVKTFKELSASFLQDSRSWILFPTTVTFYVSTDGKTFKAFGGWSHDGNWRTTENLIQDATYTSKKKIKARYIKVVAKNFGKLPEGHVGFGGDAFIFVDEISVR